MENEKIEYIVTIDGTDCTGKSTLWKEANDYNKNVQIRGILSNIAYGLKYGRDVDEMINLYNEFPINYIIYLVNPDNNKKLEMLYNRLKARSYDSDFIQKELEDASSTWKDYVYFKRAIDTLYEKYKGEIVVKTVDNNSFDDFKEYIKDKNIMQIDVDTMNSHGLRTINSTIDNFEVDAKEVSEFKYIVFINRLNKEEAIENLYNGLDEEHKEMLNNLYDMTNETSEDVYDSLGSITVDDLVDYLDNYEIRAEVNVTCEVSTYTDLYIPLRDIGNSRCLEDVIYDNYSLMDDLYDTVRDDVGNSELDISVEGTR